MPPATDCGQPLLKNTTITIMVDNTNVLVWQQRLQKTEDLIHKRRQDLQGHEQRCLSLQDELTQQQEISDQAVQDLAGLREQCEAATRHRVDLQRDITNTRQDAAAAKDTARLVAQKQALEQQLHSLRSAVECERKVQQQYEATVARHMQDRGQRTQELQDRAEQIRTRLERLEQQESKLCLPGIISKLTHQHEQLQAKLQQLTATLTDNKQANACMRARVEAAAADTKAQLQTATDRLADVKREAFQLTRQAAVNDTRLQQLRQESGRNKRKCAELEALIARATTVMDQLAANCDL